MKQRRCLFTLFAGCCAALFLVAACKEQKATPPPESRGVPVVYTTFYPTAYFAQRIGGDRIKVVCPLPSDADPIFWRPSDQTIAAYQQADLIIINGASFEKWIERTTLPRSRVIDTAQPLTDRFITFTSEITHSHGPGGDHSHVGTDGHTWLDPNNARVQALQIRDALSKRYPNQGDAFAEGYDALSRDLDALDRRLRELQPRMQTLPLLASHPAYNYLAARYHWNLRSLDLDPAVELDAQAFADLEDLLIVHRARLMLWESAPLPETAQRLKAELGIESVVFSPCELLAPAALTRGDDYIIVMNRNIDRLAAAAVVATTSQ